MQRLLKAQAAYCVMEFVEQTQFENFVLLSELRGKFYKQTQFYGKCLCDKELCEAATELRL